VPEEIRWIPAVTHGRVERIAVRPGTAVAADTVILVLSNPTQA
jgi:HlyD family secretion protein